MQGDYTANALELKRPKQVDSIQNNASMGLGTTMIADAVGRRVGVEEITHAFRHAGDLAEAICLLYANGNILAPNSTLSLSE